MNALEQGTFPTQKRKAAEITGVQPEQSAKVTATREMTDRATREQALRSRTDRLVRQALSLDARAFLETGPADWEQRLKKEQTFDTLATGQMGEQKELSSEDVIGTSRVSRCELSGEIKLQAYLKASFAEARFTRDGHLSVWDGETLEFQDVPIGDDEKEYQEIVRDFCRGASKSEFDAARRFGLSQKYGLPENDPRFDMEAILPRLEIPAGELPEREYAMSRLCEALEWSEIPKTAIRPDGSGLDIASVQEAVHSQDPKDTASFLTAEELEHFWETPPSEWENVQDAEGNPQPYASLVRLACLDYLAGSMDRHRGNLLYDRKSKTFSGIDNAFCFSMLNGVQIGESVHSKKSKVYAATAETSLHPTMRLVRENPNVRNIRSIPLEILMKHNLALADHDRDQLVKTYENLFPEGQPSSYLQDLLQFVFKHEKIAQVEAKELQKRFHMLMELGRPPELKPNEDYMPLAEENVAALRIRREKKAKEAQQTAA